MKYYVLIEKTENGTQATIGQRTSDTRNSFRLEDCQLIDFDTLQECLNFSKGCTIVAGFTLLDKDVEALNQLSETLIERKPMNSGDIASLATQFEKWVRYNRDDLEERYNLAEMIHRMEVNLNDEDIDTVEALENILDTEPGKNVLRWIETKGMDLFDDERFAALKEEELENR